MQSPPPKRRKTNEHDYHNNVNVPSTVLPPNTTSRNSEGSSQSTLPSSDTYFNGEQLPVGDIAAIKLAQHLLDQAVRPGTAMHTFSTLVAELDPSHGGCIKLVYCLSRTPINPRQMVSCAQNLPDHREFLDRVSDEMVSKIIDEIRQMTVIGPLREFDSILRALLSLTIQGYVYPQYVSVERSSFHYRSKSTAQQILNGLTTKDFTSSTSAESYCATLRAAARSSHIFKESATTFLRNTLNRFLSSGTPGKCSGFEETITTYWSKNILPIQPQFSQIAYCFVDILTPNSVFQALEKHFKSDAIDWLACVASMRAICSQEDASALEKEFENLIKHCMTCNNPETMRNAILLSQIVYPFDANLALCASWSRRNKWLREFFLKDIAKSPAAKTLYYSVMTSLLPFFSANTDWLSNLISEAELSTKKDGEVEIELKQFRSKAKSIVAESSSKGSQLVNLPDDAFDEAMCNMAVDFAKTDKFPHEILVARFSQPALLQKKILSAMCRPRSRPPDVLYLWEAMKKNRIISEQDFRTLQECYAQSSSEVNRGGVPSGTGNNRNTTPSNKIQSFAHASKIDDLQEVLTTEFELHFTKEEGNEETIKSILSKALTSSANANYPLILRSLLHITQSRRSGPTWRNEIRSLLTIALKLIQTDNMRGLLDAMRAQIQASETSLQLIKDTATLLCFMFSVIFDMESTVSQAANNRNFINELENFFAALPCTTGDDLLRLSVFIAQYIETSATMFEYLLCGKVSVIQQCKNSKPGDPATYALLPVTALQRAVAMKRLLSFVSCAANEIKTSPELNLAEVLQTLKQALHLPSVQEPMRHCPPLPLKELMTMLLSKAPLNNDTSNVQKSLLQPIDAVEFIRLFALQISLAREYKNNLAQMCNDLAHFAIDAENSSWVYSLRALLVECALSMQHTNPTSNNSKLWLVQLVEDCMSSILPQLPIHTDITHLPPTVSARRLLLNLFLLIRGLPPQVLFGGFSPTEADYTQLDQMFKSYLIPLSDLAFEYLDAKFLLQGFVYPLLNKPLASTDQLQTMHNFLKLNLFMQRLVATSWSEVEPMLSLSADQSPFFVTLHDLGSVKTVLSQLFSWELGPRATVTLTQQLLRIIYDWPITTADCLIQYMKEKLNFPGTSAIESANPAMLMHIDRGPTFALWCTIMSSSRLPSLCRALVTASDELQAQKTAVFLDCLVDRLLLELCILELRLHDNTPDESLLHIRQVMRNFLGALLITTHNAFNACESNAAVLQNQFPHLLQHRDYLPEVYLLVRLCRRESPSDPLARPTSFAIDKEFQDIACNFSALALSVLVQQNRHSVVTFCQLLDVNQRDAWLTAVLSLHMNCCTRRLPLWISGLPWAQTPTASELCDLMADILSIDSRPLSLNADFAQRLGEVDSRLLSTIELYQPGAFVS